MIAQLLVSQSDENIVNEIDKNLVSLNQSKIHPDVLYLNESSIGIRHARKVQEFFSFKPYVSNGKTVVVEKVENITPEAQNALLKTLEELPAKGNMFIGINNENIILPTVLSRCHSVYLDNISYTSKPDKYTPDIKLLLQSDLEERFKYIEKLKEKNEFFTALISYFHQLLISEKPNREVTNFLEKLLTAQRWIKSNVNIRGVLEYLMIVMPVVNE